MKNDLSIRRSKLSAVKQAMLSKRLGGELKTSSDAKVIPKSSQHIPTVLSFAQQRLWFLDQLEPGGSAYNIPTGFSIYGFLDVGVLENSIKEMIHRHESFRTRFASVDGQPVQIISPPKPFILPVVDLQNFPKPERKVEANRLITEEAQHPFNLVQGPLVRFLLLRLDKEDYVFLMTIHHIVSDGWSLGVFARELGALYKAFFNAFSMGPPSTLTELPIQYADFAHWQQQWLQGEVLETQLDYWKEQLKGLLPVLQLPTDRPRPAVQTFRGEKQSLLLPKELCETLKALSRREGVTLFMTLLAAFKTLLYRYTGQEDMLVDSPIAGRTRVEFEGLIGFFVNTLVLRTSLSGNPSFRELLGRVSEVAHGAYAHQDLPFEKLVEVLQPERSLSYSPLFQVMFVLMNAPQEALDLPGLTVTPLEVDSGAAMFDLTLYMWEVSDGLAGSLEYNSDLFDRATIILMLRHFQKLLEGIVSNPEQRLSNIPLLTVAEHDQLLVEWNATRVDYPRDKCIHELFEEQVVRTPGAVAVICADERVTYRELNRRANQLAHRLKSLGVGPEVPVGICIERSLEMIVGLFGILKAGGAYVPIDPSYPKERIAYIMADAKVPVLLINKRFCEKLPEQEAEVVCLDLDWKKISKESKKNLSNKTKPGNLAYILYTSGSTGKPKGVLGLHRSAVNRFNWMWKKYPFKAGEVCCQKTSLGFVDSVWEIFGPLLQGIRTVIIPDEVVKDPHRLLDTLLRDKVTRIVLVPSLLRVILNTYGDLQDRLPELKIWVTSGEMLSLELAQRFLEMMPQSVLLNLYGSTEVSADVTYFDTVLLNKTHMKIPIGRPIDNTQIYILDKHRKPVPVGVMGEIYVGGEGLARGYHHLTELTHERFISNPFVDRPFVDRSDSFLYKTGDLARYLPDGNIEFLGRVDHQVKIHGFRIELGEIETILSQHPDVRETVAIVREDVPGDKRLAAYLVPTQGVSPTVNDLQDFLKNKLPEYMVPSSFVVLDALPLTPSKKVDRHALPKLDAIKPESGYAAPRNQLDLQLTGIWQKILGVKPIGIKDNFFELGGHSLLAAQLFAQIGKTLGKNIPLVTLFKVPTIEQIADIFGQKDWKSS